MDLPVPALGLVLLFINAAWASMLVAIASARYATSRRSSSR